MHPAFHPGSLEKGQGAQSAISPVLILEAVRLGHYGVLESVPVPPSVRDQVWLAFRTVARRGEITGRQLWAILEDMGASDSAYSMDDVIALRSVRFDAAVATVAYAINQTSGADGAADETMVAAEGDANEDDDDDAAAETQAVREGKATLWLRSLRRRVTSRLDEIRPQTLLLVASGAVIVFLGVLVTVAAAVAWLEAWTAAEEDGLRVTATIIAKMAEELEQRFVGQSAAGMVDVSVTTVRTSTALLRHSEAFAAVSQRVQTVALAAAVGAFAGETRTQAVQLGSQVRSRLLDAYVGSHVRSSTGSSESCSVNASSASEREAVARVTGALMDSDRWIGAHGAADCARNASVMRERACSEIVAPARGLWAQSLCLSGLGVCSAVSLHGRAVCVTSSIVMDDIVGDATPLDHADTNCSSTLWKELHADAQSLAAERIVGAAVDATHDHELAPKQVSLRQAARTVGDSSSCNAESTLLNPGVWITEAAAGRMVDLQGIQDDGAELGAAVATTWPTGVPAAPFLRSLTSNATRLAHRRDGVVRTADHLNWAFVRTTEIVVGGYDVATGVFVPQLNSFRFPEKCFGACERFPPATRAMKQAFSHPDEVGWGIAPDYRPWPAAGASAYLGAYGLGIVMERDVSELRGSALDVLTGILDRVQHAFRDTMLVEAFQLYGAPPMPFFRPDAPCPGGTDCLKSPALGVYFQYACQHCERLDLLTFDSSVIELKTDVTKLRCPGNCSASASARIAVDFARHLARSEGPDVSTVGQVVASKRRPLVSRRSSAFRDAADGSDEAELGVVAVVANLSLGLRVSIARTEVTNPLSVGLTASVLGALVLMVLGVLVVLGLSNETMNALDETWVAHQRDIRESRERFGVVVREVIAPPVVQRLLAGESIIAERVRVAIVGTDICGFSKYLTDHAPRKVVRLVLYYREMLRELAGVYDLYRLHAIGDTVLYFTMRNEADDAPGGAPDAGAAGRPGNGGTGDGAATGNLAASRRSAPSGVANTANQDGANQGAPNARDAAGFKPESAAELGVVDSNHQVCRAMRFAASVMQMFSDETAHYPSAYPPLAELFPDVDKASRRRYAGIPAVRVGCHWGGAVLAMVDKTNVIPQLDLHGAVIASAHRLTLTVAPHEIGVTGAFRDTLIQNDPSRAYTFGEPQRLMMRSVGWLTTFRVVSFKQRSINEAVQRLGVAATPSDFPFDPETQTRKSLHTVGIEQYRIKPAGPAGAARTRF